MSPNHRFLPFLDWTKELRDPRILRADILAGITVALVLIPQSMAYAQLAGLPAYYGLYAAFLPPAVAALWGSSRQLATGPVAMVSLMTGAALVPFAASGQDVVPIAILMALLAGVFQLTLGLLRLGLLVDFLSHPVLIGVTNAAALVIATSQLDKLLGVRAAKADHHYETVWNVCVAASQGVYWPAVGIGLLAFALMIGARKLDKRIPGVLLAVVVTTVLAWRLDYHQEIRVPAPALAGTAGELARQWQDDRAAMAAFVPRLAEAQTRHAEARKTHGAKHALTVEARLAADELQLSRDDREKELQAHWNALRGLRYHRSDGPDGPVFHAFGEEPSGSANDGREWRLRSFGDDGRALMVAGGNVVGEVPSGLPAPRLPSLHLADILAVLPSALMLSLIGFVEAISIAKAMALRTRQRVDADQELIGQGLANLTGAATQGYPVSGSFSRSAVNLSAGAITGFAGVVTCIVVAVTLLWLTPLLRNLPEATLAAVIMMAVVNLVKIGPVLHAWKVSRRDAIVSVVTFAVTLVAAPHLDIGILVGVGLALTAYVATTMRPQVAVLARHPDGSLRDAAIHKLPRCDRVLVLRFDGRLYFANTSHFEDRLIAELAAQPSVRAVVIAGAGINSIDATGEEVLGRLVERLEEQGVWVVFWGLRHRVQEVLVRTGVVARLGANRFVAEEGEALDLAHRLAGAPPGHRADCPLHVLPGRETFDAGWGI